MLMWGRFRPDAGGPNTGFAEVADNVIPQSAGVGQGGALLVGYGPFPQLSVQGGASALSGAPRGSISLTTQNGTYEVFFATASTIEQMTSSFTFNVIESGRNVTSGDDVSFTHFGAYLLNTDTTDGFKAYNVETPAGNNVVSGAPTARALFQCNNVVFALDCNGNNKAWKSSAIGDHTEWILRGANGGQFTDGEALICGVDMENGRALIFQQHAIRIIQFGNAVTPALYAISKAADGRGSVGARSVVSFDAMAFFLDTDGFYKFDFTNGITPIGAEKVNRWFLGQTDNSKLATVQGSVDPLHKIICWRFFSLNNSSTTIADRMICYDWQLDEWFTCTVNTTALARVATPGYVLDTMDGFGTLDQMTQIALDDRFWQGGAPVFGGLDSNFEFGTFSGSSLAATLQSMTTNSGFSSLENEITPISDNANSKIAVGVSDKLSDSLTWKTAQGRTRAGKVKFRAHGLNVAFQETHTAGDTWTFTNGVDYEGAPKGGPV
jgi:hypothetical protein